MTAMMTAMMQVNILMIPQIVYTANDICTVSDTAMSVIDQSINTLCTPFRVTSCIRVSLSHVTH